MAKRKLTDDEKKLSLKMIGKLEEEIEYQEYLKEHAELMIDKGLYQNYMFKLKEFKGTLRGVLEDINELVGKIEVLNVQIKDGVEVKKDNKKMVGVG